MHDFVTTDSNGNFMLRGRPWFLHAAVYFGRRPGTCGADWMGENFDHNLSFLDRDIETMRDLGINTLGLFVPSHLFFDGVTPVRERFDQLDEFLARIGRSGLRAIIFDLRTISRDAWCAAHGIDPGEGPWTPALHPEAERAFIETKRLLHAPFRERTEIAGWAMQIPRFFGYGFSVPQVQAAWTAWLRERFGWDFGLVREAFALGRDEYTWERVRMPTEMDPYFNQRNPRSFEFALMQQELVTRGTNRVIRAARAFTPDHLMVTSMEGCCFSSGHLTNLIPEKLEADALWIEYYHWEGLRSYHLVKEEDRRWMPEPVAEKPSVEILNAAGYVQMLTQWMKRGGKALIMCHGVDIGDHRRGVRSEEDQFLMLDRYNAWYHEAGGHGIAYWCWNDDELSKTYTRQFGYELGSDTDASKKAYQQAGETMGIVRYDGTPRPIGEKIRARSTAMQGRKASRSPGQALVLLPAPVFQSLYRYRANLSAFGLFTSLGRQGIVAEMAFTASGTTSITLTELQRYPWIILGASSYARDLPEVPETLLRYVAGGGTLFLPLVECDSLIDSYLRRRRSDALWRLSGAKACERILCNEIADVRGVHPSFAQGLPERWTLEMDEPAYLSRVELGLDSEVLVTAGAAPLLYRHPIGRGSVYVFTWSLDVFIYEGNVLDHSCDAWDCLWQGVAAELGIECRPDSPLRETILEMMARLRT